MRERNLLTFKNDICRVFNYLMSTPLIPLSSLQVIFSGLEKGDDNDVEQKEIERVREREGMDQSIYRYIDKTDR